jgi:phage-related protein
MRITASAPAETMMAAVGKGVEELRVWDDSGTYRVIYLLG